MIVVANLKMNLKYSEIIVYEKKAVSFPIIICPSFPYLNLFKNGKYTLGAQNISEYENGSYTGEVSGEQLHSMNVKYVIVGHSERRNYYHEDEKIFIKKIKNAIKNHLKVIYCIGETKEERLRQKTLMVLLKQINKVFNELNEEERKNIIIAYEPVWAIGTGKIPTNKDIDEIMNFIKTNIYNEFNIKIKVLYGGSINSNNTKSLIKINSLDGFIIGSSSNDVIELSKILYVIETNLN